MCWCPVDFTILIIVAFNSFISDRTISLTNLLFQNVHSYSWCRNFLVNFIFRLCSLLVFLLDCVKFIDLWRVDIFMVVSLSTPKQNMPFHLFKPSFVFFVSILVLGKDLAPLLRLLLVSLLCCCYCKGYILFPYIF